MSYTRRPTGFENPDDYVFLYDGKEVGRCYRGLFASVEGWLWTIYGSNISGIEESLEVAQERFKETYDAFRTRPPQSR